MKRVAALAFAGFLLTAPAVAGVTEFSVASMDCPVLPGFVVNDILIDFTGQYTGAQALVELSQGTIFLHDFTTHFPPIASLLPVVPSLECDTFVAQGSPVTPGSFGIVSPGGGAVDLGDPVFEFSPMRISAAWNPAGGVTIQNQNDFLIMRLTMSKNAQGTAKFLASAAGTPSTVSWFVRNGVVTAVPEPASGILVGFTLLALAMRLRSGR